MRISLAHAVSFEARHTAVDLHAPNVAAPLISRRSPTYGRRPSRPPIRRLLMNPVAIDGTGMKENTPMRELLQGAVKDYSPLHAQRGQFSTILSARGRFLFQRSAMPRTKAPCWGDISFTGTRLSTHRRRRGQAGLRDNTLSRTSYPDAAVEEAPEGVAAAPVGGGTWPGTPEPQAPPVWRAPEGPEGTGGLRGAAPNEVRPPSLAGGRALRRPEHQRGNKQTSRKTTNQEGPEGQAAADVGGGRARAGLEIDHSEPSGSRVAISRAGRRPRAHQAARPKQATRRPAPRTATSTARTPARHSKRGRH